MENSLPTCNNAITAYLGGPSLLKQFFNNIQEEEFLVMSPEDLKFHLSWDWMMPVWKKLRKDLLSTEADGAMLFALSRALDEVDLEAFHRIVSNYCLEWCKRKNIKL